MGLAGSTWNFRGFKTKDKWIKVLWKLFNNNDFDMDMKLLLVHIDIFGKCMIFFERKYQFQYDMKQGVSIKGVHFFLYVLVPQMAR